MKERKPEAWFPTERDHKQMQGVILGWILIWGKTVTKDATTATDETVICKLVGRIND